MNIKKLETIKIQANAFNIDIVVINYDVNRYSVTIGKHLYTDFNRALSAITTQYLKSKR